MWSEPQATGNGPTFSKTLETRVSVEKYPKQNENTNDVGQYTSDNAGWFGKGGQALLYAVPPIGRLTWCDTRPGYPRPTLSTGWDISKS